MTETSAHVSRTFFELPTKDGHDVEDISFLRGFSRDGSLAWEELLQADRVLIVSEAGMGKTYECQRRQKRLWEDGEPAFFLELADLGSEDLTAHFSPAEKLRFLGWQSAQTERAVFFLDSIDELKLTSRSFQGTLKRFATAIGGNLGRACVVLTTRPGTDDREAVEHLLPIPSTTSIVLPEEIFVNAAMREQTNNVPEDAFSSRWRYVALAPLDSEQQRTIARDHYVSDPETLLTAIEAEHAHEFAKRPLDFIELCEDWNATGKIRGHRDQIESNINIKLKPNLERQEPAELSAMKAREGAERLALAALMTRRFAFWHGKDTQRGRGDGALDPALVLSDWQPSEVRTLLERPLFGFATYARVRFQNRSIIEYLAAERLRSLLAKGLAPRTLNRLLFVTTPERVELVRPAMQPVAAWLAPTQPSVLAELLKRDPSLLLRFGDPGTLDSTLQIAALERYVAVYGAGGWRGMHVPPLQARRLSSPILSPAIARLWSEGIENMEVRETLLDLIETGKLILNSDIAFEAATDAKRETRERLSALQALAALGDERLPRILDRMAALEAGWTGRLATSAIVHLFPQVMSVPQLIGILAGLTYARGHGDGISRLLPESIARAELSSAMLESLRWSLTDLIAADQHWDSLTYRIQSSRRDLVRPLIRVCELQLRNRAQPASLADSIALVLQLSSDDHDRDERSAALRTQLASASHSVRDAVFWAQERLLTAILTGEKSEIREVRMLWPPAMLLQGTDAPWLGHALSEAARPASQRMIALKSLIHLARENDDQLGHLKPLRVLVADAFDLSEHLDRFISAIEDPPAAPSWIAEQAKRRDDHARQQNETRAFWVEFFRSLIAESFEPLDDEGRRKLAWRLTDVMARASRDSQYAGWNRSFLERVFEKKHVDHLRQLVIDVWRTVKPTLPSERAEDERNLYYPMWRIGLAGLYAEAEDPAWTRRLDSSEAELAMRYAITSMYDLPIWVDDLAADHPEVVLDILRPELDAQLIGSDVQHEHSSLVVSIAHGRPKLLALMLGDVRFWVREALARGVGSLYKADKFERAIELLVENGDRADMAMVRAAALAALQDAPLSAQVSFWLPFLMRLAPSEAVDQLERLAGKSTPAEMSPVTQWFAVLFGHNARQGSVTSELVESSSLLARLTVLAYEHVRIEDDRLREGVRNSNIRDDAEFARSQLLSALFKSRGGDAWREKLNFVQNPLVAHFRDRGVAIAMQSLAEEWDAPNYTLADLALLERSWDVPPVTRADMSAMLLDRLDQLDDRLREDSLPRKTWASTKEESELRRLVAAEMERLAKGAYSVSQEQVTAEEKETDVRLRSSGYEMEAVIELKIGENGYSYKDFSKALNHQLLGRYMLPEARRVGCLLISISRNRQWKHPEHGRLIDIDEVVLLLREEAKGVVRSLGYESLLEVRALDLRPRQLS